MADSPLALAEALFHAGTQAIERNDMVAAEASLRAALQHAPMLAQAHANLAWVLERRRAADEAMAHYIQALALQPDNARVYLNYGALLAELKLHDDAEAAYRRGIALDPGLPGGWSNLGALLALTGRDDAAQASFRQALTLDSAHALAHFNLACLLLRKGRFEEGWLHLEARDWYAAFAAELSFPRWQGQPLQGAAILVSYDAGHGDMIQFSRYATLLRERGAVRVDMVCHPALKPLLAMLDGVDKVMAFDEAWPRSGYDWWAPVLSLPHLFGTRLDTIPARLPYLRAPSDRTTHWRSELARRCTEPNLRVGLVWQGNPEFQNDAERSLPGLSVLAPLWRVAGIQFISLQKGFGAQEAREPPPGQALVDVAPGLNDFADTAAVVQQLDLVISVDTAVAHLSGALGKPCWVLLPAYMTDWRWLEERADSPWYPGVMRLFRQAQTSDWTPVVAQVREALTQWTSVTRPRSSG